MLPGWLRPAILPNTRQTCRETRQQDSQDKQNNKRIQDKPTTRCGGSHGDGWDCLQTRWLRKDNVLDGSHLRLRSGVLCLSSNERLECNGVRGAVVEHPSAKVPKASFEGTLSLCRRGRVRRGERGTEAFKGILKRLRSLRRYLKGLRRRYLKGSSPKTSKVS